MERLTKDDLNKVCYDPCEICGMDKHCTKGCHEEGGCTGGCHILKMHRKLAKYEDLEEQCVKDNLFGLHELCEKWKAFSEEIVELLDYHKKQEQGLLIELPCKVGDTFWEVSWSNDSFYPRVAHSLQHCCYVKDRLGTWCFLTEAEAEEALAKMGGK